MVRFGILIFFGLVQAALCRAEIREARNIADALREADRDTVVFLDLDETTFTSKSIVLTDAWFHRTIEYYRKMGQSPAEAQESTLQDAAAANLTTDFQWVDPRLPELIAEAKKRGARIYGFTARYPATREQTKRQLGGLPGDGNSLWSEPPKFRGKLSAPVSGAIFEDGILFGAHQEKGPVLKAFLKKIPRSKKVLFIDDTQSNVVSVEAALAGTGVEVLAYHYLSPAKDLVLPEIGDSIPLSWKRSRPCFAVAKLSE